MHSQGEKYSFNLSIYSKHKQTKEDIAYIYGKGARS